MKKGGWVGQGIGGAWGVFLILRWALARLTCEWCLPHLSRWCTICGFVALLWWALALHPPTYCTPHCHLPPRPPPPACCRYFPVMLGTWAAAFAASLVGLSSSATTARRV